MLIQTVNIALRSFGELNDTQCRLSWLVGKSLALFASSCNRLLVFDARSLLLPLLEYSVFGRVLERVERSVVVTSVTLEARSCLSTCQCIVVCIVGTLRAFTGCSMNLRQGHAGDMSDVL